MYRQIFQTYPKIVSLKVLTQEDWNLVLFLGMERTSHWAALYFVALMTFGNYVLFNLLVAILVEGFSNQVRTDFVTKNIPNQLFSKKFPFTNENIINFFFKFLS